MSVVVDREGCVPGYTYLGTDIIIFLLVEIFAVRTSTVGCSPKTVGHRCLDGYLCGPCHVHVEAAAVVKIALSIALNSGR